ncbi:MAG: 23S rRNA (pseudouridine(1915)-N(3))-methyltransferase RlmH [Candidatus Izemoplasmatales bacterium]|jgi:23S rRNA (pseudouridine1915-N3)-methyltransferase|nr:23S rRNA (pseudouridine(1915)-N(3))-methyltransferase RlmH [Candidatus Izemoplasmatales bacterium]MDD5293110.1 23S rRNA (pseudouridine(1915)-N(3))-methyltransferase RlmH [Candidatus Izemoplasmatales bacterium]
MMRITVIAVGKLKESFLLQGVNEYLKRLKGHVKVDVIEIAEEKEKGKTTAHETIRVIEEEGQRILRALPKDAYVVALDVQGEMLTSHEFADMIEHTMNYHSSSLAFIIGGSYGLAESIKEKSNRLISFSRLTFPHQLMRLIFFEQIYRAFMIMNSEPYHK